MGAWGGGEPRVGWDLGWGTQGVEAEGSLECGSGSGAWRLVPQVGGESGGGGWGREGLRVGAGAWGLEGGGFQRG